MRLNESFWRDRQVVYRYFDEDDRLLYVGCTKNLARRDAEHDAGSSGAFWYPLAARICVQVFPTREAALAAELRAIADEDPAYNLRRADGRIDDRSRWTKEDHRRHRAWASRPVSRVGWWRALGVAS